MIPINELPLSLLLQLLVMVISMTGFAKAEGAYQGNEFSVEIKSLNSKYSDVRVKVPFPLRSKEIEIRKLVSSQIPRGKIEIAVLLNDNPDNEAYVINKHTFTQFYRQLSDIKEDLQLDDGDMMQSILRIPNVVSIASENALEEEWNLVKRLVNESLEKLVAYQTQEGNALAADLLKNVKNIQSLLEKVEPYEKARITQLKERLANNLNEYLQNAQVDQNRFEQEVLYYIEKLDFNEEKVRLAQHCHFFREILEEKNQLIKGKKLAFVSQEMGREINTLGAKAQFSAIQRIVVQMKDELEKIKEQLANVR